MKLLRLYAFLILIVGVLASVSFINLNPTGDYAKLSPKGGLYVSVVLLIYVLFGEMGFLPYRFKGRKRRSANDQIMNPLIMGDKDVVLRVCFVFMHKMLLPFLDRGYHLTVDSYS